MASASVFLKTCFAKVHRELQSQGNGFKQLNVGGIQAD
jgi:hypothetical protein